MYSRVPESCKKGRKRVEVIFLSSDQKKILHFPRFGYPPELTFKLYDRRGRCFMNNLKSFEAIQSFKEAINRIEAGHCNLETKKREVFLSETRKRLVEAEEAEAAVAKKKKGGISFQRLKETFTEIKIQQFKVI